MWNWASIERLISDLDKRSPLEGNLNGDLLEYSEFLRRHNGAEGCIGPQQYLSLWSAEQVAELNAAYGFAEWAPDVVLIGSDGAGTGYGINRVTGRYVSVPFVGSAEDMLDEGASFEEFLQNRHKPT